MGITDSTFSRDLSGEMPESMRQRYVERRRQEIGVLREALRLGCHDPVIRIGHQLKGNAVTFGFPQLEGIGERLEIAGLSGDLSSAAVIVDEFELWIGDRLGSR